MSTVSRRSLVRAAAVTACAGSLLALPTAAALADGVPAASTGQRTLVKSLSLADGESLARIYRVADDAYEAEILRDGARVATLAGRDGATDVGGSGGLHVSLRADGRLTSWVGDTRPAGDASHALFGDGRKTGTRSGHTVPVSAHTPESAARAGGTAEALRLNTVADGPGEGVLLLAAGGGIAAIGAAGLGFAMVRRGRTEG
ncbi:hypothetical protein ADK55_06520 [Streptomyces sp. WM4235]|uniref:hypothetical protein n=1 Tax=Streptomyces sp. WM4235 TaxID=1415551 RepID=UPI0006AE7FA3|nr:hypothetical protein [Streptomyces sp. WM4235]KOU66079.1 hypothetical protein ADK55_06520 [Streptomyces sp. WM4235]